MNTIFLDIDGVLRSLASITVYGTGVGGKAMHGFDDVSVGLIEKLCAEAPAQIVVSSSWRTGDLEKTKQQFVRTPASCLVPFMVGETVDLEEYIKTKSGLDCDIDTQFDVTKKRGLEIDHYIKTHELDRSKYIIIDDENMMLLNQVCCYTDFNDGFLLRHFAKCMKYFNPSHRLATLHKEDGLF